MDRKIMAALFAPILALATTIVCAPTSSAAANYCAYSFTMSSGRCFQSEAELRAHRSESAEIDLVAVYNWINYNQSGGYIIFTGPHSCTPEYDDEGYRFNFSRLASFVFYLNDGRPGENVNNAISSVSTYYAPKCDIKFWDGESFTGDSSEWIDRCSHLGTCTAENWYDRAGSFKLS